LTTRMLKELGLTGCADTIVGGELIKGISGGERKRTSVGVELVTKPPLVFLDEPTSGLDSFSAVQLCEVLKKVANSGASVLFTIHQPSSEIFASFDRLILLNKGRVMYQGPVRSVPEYFEDRGRPCPERYNPADWIMDVAQVVPIKTLDEEGFFPVDKRELGDPFEPDDDHDELGITLRRSHHKSKQMDKFKPENQPPGFFTQTGMLFFRELINIKRDVASAGARFGLTLFMSILVGIIFWKVGETDPSVPSNLQVSYQFHCSNGSTSATFGSVLTR
jgi:ABC-type multidrug transport system ATPase subunit